MNEFTYIDFDDDVKSIDVDRSLINVKIGDKEFGVYLSDKDNKKAYEKYGDFPKYDYSLIDIVTALEKLTNFLKLSMSIDIPKSLMK